MLFKKEGYIDPSDWTTFKDDLSSNKLEVNTVAQQFVYPLGGKAC